ncbi:two-component system sensor histidine kinase CreC [Psychrobacter sp. FDAARGOS_221]|uniref:two-component system sensor histidine kinase CreC n=1 Tax=Psychrobacter sp. FDAARGOS_221 TaxID=1975705 RepID=UPI000BB580C3|nr:two-component system sensor histidine kinase CreC [Psychrobacter sp. FDAARGOS_221]PNK61724.1 two-component system sensor histidine kinase CreC [Psychrobacter sp. FDAARGOS_221]
MSNTPSPQSENQSQQTSDSNSNEDNRNTGSTSTPPNWYAKLHPIGKDSSAHTASRKPEKILNLSLFFRIWIAVGVIVIISGIVVFNQLFTYVRPITQQVIEDTLVDTSKLLAASLQSAVESGEIYNSSYQAMLDQAFTTPSLPESDSGSAATENSNTSENIKTQPSNSSVNSESSNESQPLNPVIKALPFETQATWYHQKQRSSFRVYITDNQGIVIYDSLPEQGNHTNPEGNARGEDYSSWNDVNLTLQGKYGARTTRSDPNDSSTSVMYVAQPIYSSDGSGDIIAVVSVGKPTSTVLPYLNATRQRMLTASLIISIVTLIMAGLVAWWLRQSTLLVTRYTQSLAQDTKKPYFYLGRELNELTDTIESMKHRLENRAYVTDYVHTLTHELKSPLTAIRASGELLEETDLDSEDRQMLSQTITEQSIKLHSLIDRLLLLAKIEQPTFKLAIQAIDPDALVQTLIAGSEMQRQYQHLEIDYQCDLKQSNQSFIFADEFWMTQALQNVLDNALYFAHHKVLVSVTTQQINKAPFIKLSFINDGEPIPEYALAKVFDRYFSLSHQYNKPTNNPAQTPSSPAPRQQGKKGTGLGLTLVKQVIERHGGYVSIHNLSDQSQQHNKTPETNSGVEVVILLPIAPLQD